MPIDQAKLAALKASGSTKVGGQRVKVAPKAAPSDSSASKIIQAVNRLGSRPIPKVDSCWMFCDDNTVRIFTQPKVNAAVQCNTWAIQGRSVTKSLTDPSIMQESLQHMGMDTLSGLQSMLGAMGGGAGMPGMGGMPDVGNFDEVQEEVPDLVE